ncbi:MAG: inositol monophosphatase [Candidatus Buchananbacteria bacterium]
MKNFVIKLAKQAGLEINQRFNHDRIVKVKNKSQIVTAADLISDKIIVSAIKKKYPTHGILSEESGTINLDSDYLWAVDPVDGTTNYFIGSPLFAVSISLFYKNQPILGVAYAPAMNELYVAEAGKGAYLNNKKIHVSKSNVLADSFLTFCHGSTKSDIKRAVKIYNKIKLNSLDSRQLGSAALELGFVAAGRTECIMIPGAHVYDVAAGVLLVRQAGGKVTDFLGKEWNLKSKDMVASNGRIHNQLLKFLKNI